MRLAQWRRVLTIWLSAWLCLGASMACAQVFAPVGPYTHADSQLVLPDILGGMPRVSAYNYEARRPGLGVSIKYAVQAPVIFADIYVFNGGRPLIPEGTSDPLVEQMFTSAIGEIRGMGELGRYGNVSLIDADSITLGDKPGARRVLRARFSYTLNGGDVYSHVYALAVHNHFVKLRFTYRQDQATEAVPVLAGVLRDLGRVVGDNLQ